MNAARVAVPLSRPEREALTLLRQLCDTGFGQLAIVVRNGEIIRYEYGPNYKPGEVTLPATS